MELESPSYPANGMVLETSLDGTANEDAVGEGWFRCLNVDVYWQEVQN